MLEIKTFVGGSRRWLSPKLIEARLRKFLDPSYTGYLITVIHGAAPGVDNIAGDVAKSLGFQVRSYPAIAEGRVWPSAGIIRNAVMLEREHPSPDGKYFDIALLFHDDPNLGKGTKDMKARLDKADPPIPIEICIDRGL